MMDIDHENGQLKLTVEDFELMSIVYSTYQ